MNVRFVCSHPRTCDFWSYGSHFVGGKWWGVAFHVLLGLSCEVFGKMPVSSLPIFKFGSLSCSWMIRSVYVYQIPGSSWVASFCHCMNCLLTIRWCCLKISVLLWCCPVYFILFPVLGVPYLRKPFSNLKAWKCMCMFSSESFIAESVTSIHKVYNPVIIS